MRVHLCQSLCIKKLDQNSCILTDAVKSEKKKEKKQKQKHLQVTHLPPANTSFLVAIFFFFFSSHTGDQILTTFKAEISGKHGNDVSETCHSLSFMLLVF